jgi:NADH:ubiquinone oxidoreductase subunit E
MSNEETEVFVCLNVDCKSRGSQEVLDYFLDRLEELGIDHISPEPYLCFSACQYGPNVIIPSKRTWLSGVTTEDIDQIIEFIQGDANIDHLTQNNEPRLKKLIFDIIDAGLLPGRGDFF